MRKQRKVFYKVLLLLALSTILVGLVSRSGHAEVTFTFDDSWRSAKSEAFPVLYRYGYPATLYLVTKGMGYDSHMLDWGDVHQLALKGWDVECHTYSHKDLTAIPLDQARTEIDKAIHDLQWHGYPAHHFAAPYGNINPKVLEVVKHRFVSNRAAEAQGNELNWEDKLNRYNLSAINLSEKTDMWTIERYIEHATYEKRWLIFVVHKVVEKPEDCKDDYTISKVKLAKIVRYCVDQGTKVVTVDQYFKQRHLEK